MDSHVIGPCAQDTSLYPGAIVGIASVNPMPKAAGRWNVFEIYARGAEMTVKLNGTVTVHVRDGKLTGGAFTLQYGGFNSETKTGGGAIKWRKLDVKPL